MTTDTVTSVLCIDYWLQSGKYLPKCLRSFTKQKEVFKAIHTLTKEDPSSPFKRPDWATAHVYVIDTFLWFMARRGYTLQKTRTKANFRDLETDVNKVTEDSRAAFEAMLKNPTSMSHCAISTLCDDTI